MPEQHLMGFTSQNSTVAAATNRLGYLALGESMNGNSSCRGSGMAASRRPLRLERDCGLDWPTRPPIGQPLASDALDRKRGAGRVVIAERDPMVVTEIKFAEIPLQVFRTDVMIYAVDA